MASTMSHHQAAGVREDKNGKGVSEEFTDEATALFMYSRHTRFAGGQTDGAQAPAQGQRARVGSNTQTNAQTTQGTGLQTTGDHACLYQLQHHETMGLSKLVVCIQMTKTKLHFQSPSVEGRWGGGGRKGAGGGVDIRISVYGRRKFWSKLFKWLELGGCRDAGCWSINRVG